ncbi:PiggyBac transposable element-derived protein 4 [Trichinella nelsoni]|uniref:PiggyBac transposable element-derived protein 4 n=1 Tax=Trichinella nelsoni TaxID=6336 RepID=A0A0V0RW51_9BILA|nr:PiggyBac transposable element-derived protein 4 [Trichinella nelsoni]
MHCKPVGHENLPFSKVGRSPEKFESHCSRALRGHRQCIHQWFSTRGARPPGESMRKPYGLIIVRKGHIAALASIRDVWDDWVARLPMICNSGAYVTVDKRLIPLKGRCPFRQYMPKKPAKYGIKVWTLCDAKTSYAWNMQIYTGKRASGIREKNQGMRVVLDLTAGLKGNNSICDNFFTSHELAMKPFKKKLTILGIIKKNKLELPQDVLALRRRACTHRSLCS